MISKPISRKLHTEYYNAVKVKSRALILDMEIFSKTLVLDFVLFCKEAAPDKSQSIFHIIIEKISVM